MSVLFTSVPSKRLSRTLLATGTAFFIENIEGWSGADLTSSDFGTQLYAVFRDAGNTVMELMEVDPATIDSASGVTIIRRGLAFTGDRTTELTARKLDWTKNTTIVELGSCSPQDLQYLKEYIDGIAIAGSPVAAVATLGIVKMSTAPADPDAPIAVGTNDTRVPTADEKSAMAGGGAFGTPSATNQFLTEDYIEDQTKKPTQQTFSGASTTLGDTTSQFDITNPAGTTFRYTYDGTGTDPGITAITVPVGIVVMVESAAMNVANTGSFVVTGSGANYFEVTNASGVAETNQVLSAGYLKTVTAQTYTKPAGLKYAVVEAQGAGAAGLGAGANHLGTRGGGAGAYSKKTFEADDIGATETVYVGPGGVSAASDDGNASGAITVFGALLTAPGGSGRTGGTASGGDVNISGQSGQDVMNSAQLGATGGNSMLGFGGQAATADGGVGAGVGYGAGGSGVSGDGTNAAAAAGAGAQGVIIVTEFYI